MVVAAPVAVCVAACAGMTAGGSRPVTTPAPVAGEPSVADPTAAELAARLSHHAASLSAFRGQARLEYDDGDKTHRYSQMIVVRAPDRMRIDFMNPFGPSYTVATDGTTLIAFDRGEKIFYRGLPSPRNVQRYTRVPVEIGALAALIRGVPPMLERAGEGRLSRRAEGWRWTAQIHGGGTLVVTFDPGTLDPKAVEVIGAVFTGDLSATFGDYEDVDGARVPHEVEALLSDGVRVRLRYSRIWRNLRLGDDAFRVEPPSGVRVVEMDEEAHVEGSH